MSALASLARDLRVAVRVLAKRPGVTALSILSIALGIGLTTGVFSLADAMLLRPFPIDRPGELLRVTSRGDDGRNISYNWPDYLNMVDAGQDLGELVAFTRRGSMLAGEEQDEMTITHAVTPNYFSLLGVKAALGQASVEPLAGEPAAVLGHRLWQRRFGGDPRVVGDTVVLNKRPFRVAGVMPAEFTGLTRGVATDVWISTDAWFDILGRQRERQRGGTFEMVARLKPEVVPERAAAQLDASIRGPEKHKPAPAGAIGTVISTAFAPGWRKGLVLGGGLFLALSFVLFVACANVAQMRLAQVESRRKELGIRIALGAGAWRVARQLLVETGLIALAGAGLGVLLARFLMVKLAELIAAGQTYIDLGLRLDHRVLAFTLAMLILTLVMAGLSPVRRAQQLKVSEILKSDQGATGARTGWRKKVLIVGQVAVTVALFGTAFLFVTSLRNAAATRPGMDPAKQLYVLSVGPARQMPATLWSEQACERISGIPGVVGATFARRAPLSGSGGGLTARVEIPGREPLGVRLNNVAGNYFSLLGTRVLAGRGIDANDREGGPLVVVISQLLARHVSPDENPIGEWVSIDGKMRQIVGIAEDGPSIHVHENPGPYLYLPFSQAPSGTPTLFVATAADPAALGLAIKKELKRYDPGVAIFGSATWRQAMDRALSLDRTMAALATGLGAFGVLLTAAGLFGLLEHMVSRRKRELGLRMALGASPVEINRLVLRASLHLAVWGLPIGVALLAAAAWSVRSVLLGVAPLNPLTYVVSAAAVLFLTLLSAWLPARRAARVDPMAALRSE